MNSGVFHVCFIVMHRTFLKAVWQWPSIGAVGFARLSFVSSTFSRFHITWIGLESIIFVLDALGHRAMQSSLEIA